jgi:ADP-ribose pyrophosphatase
MKNAKRVCTLISKYCSQCGVKRISEAEQFCPCGHVHYDNPIPLVLCVLMSGEKALLVRRAHPPYAKCWAPPGGYVDNGESVDAAAIREVREETGIILQEEQLIPYSIASVPSINQIYIIFRAHLDEPIKPVLCEEVLAAEWFSEDELPQDDFWLPAHIPSFKSLFKSVRTGKFKFYVNQSTYDFSSSRSLRLTEGFMGDPQSPAE